MDIMIKILKVALIMPTNNIIKNGPNKNNQNNNITTNNHHRIIQIMCAMRLASDRRTS